MYNTFLFISVLSVLVVVHEWGHFFAARRFGIAVERFSIGFGPILFRKQTAQTEFCISLIPLGGYVKLAGEDSKESKGDPSEFANRPAYQKFGVVAAGPIMNAILAVVLFTVFHAMGHTYQEPTNTTVVGSIREGYSAKAAGLLKGDKVLTVDGEAVATWQELVNKIHRAEKDVINLQVDRSGETLFFQLAPKKEKIRVAPGEFRKVSLIGIGSETKTKHEPGKPLWEAFYLGVEHVGVMSWAILKLLGQLITGQISIGGANLAGPIGIFVLVGQFAEAGIAPLLYFCGAISVSLFVFNLLPIPVLDGGHLLFTVVEAVMRRPIKEQIKERFTQAGLVFFLALIVFVFYQDFINFGLLDKAKTWLGML